MLKASNITKIYKGRKVVDNITLEINPNEIVGLLGPNGAGKTTSFYSIVGLVAPDKGKIELNNKNVTNLPVYKRSRLGLGYLPQEASVFRKLSVEKNIIAILENIPKISKKQIKEKTESLLSEFGITHIKKSLASSLSGGERRRVEIARALASDPQFILLDEPFAGIDPLAIADIQEIIKSLQNRGIGVLITDHNVRETLGICTRAYILVDGQVCEEGTPEKIASSENAKRYYLGDNFSL